MPRHLDERSRLTEYGRKWLSRQLELDRTIIVLTVRGPRGTHDSAQQIS